MWGIKVNNLELWRDGRRHGVVGEAQWLWCVNKIPKQVRNDVCGEIEMMCVEKSEVIEMVMGFHSYRALWRATERRVGKTNFALFIQNPAYKRNNPTCNYHVESYE